MKVEKYMRKSIQLILLCLLLMIGALLDLAPVHVPDGIDKLYHFIGFSFVTLFAIATYVSFFGKKLLNFFFMFLLTFGGVFAGISEFLQKFVAVRDCSVADWITNLCGISFVVALAFLAYSKERRTVELSEGRFDFKDLPVVF